MSLTNAKEPKLQTSSTWSITRRLTLLYTFSAFGILLVSTGFLYWVMANNCIREDAEFLEDKIRIVQLLLKEHPYHREALEEEVKHESLIREFEKYYVKIFDEKGNEVIKTPGIDKISSKAIPFPDPAGSSEAAPHGIKWKTPAGATYLLMSSWAELQSGKERWLLQMALDISRDELFIGNYRRKLAFVLFFGILLSAVTGVVIARQGMRSVKEITKAAKRVTATQLHERISGTRWPQELTDLATEFDEMLGRLEDSFSRLSQFSADLAHELRTPLNNLRGQTEVILGNTRSAGEYRQVLQSNLEEYERLTKMVDGLLFLARAENSQLQLERKPFDVSKEIEAVRDFHDAVAQEQEIQVSCTGNATLTADPILFRRSINNLLSNALRYTPKGGKVNISIREVDHSVEICVKDTGSGISSEHLPKIFNRFFRTDQAKSQYAEGTGLGLAIVKSIMDLHSGTIGIESEPSKGTAVVLHFPKAS